MISFIHKSNDGTFVFAVDSHLTEIVRLDPEQILQNIADITSLPIDDLVIQAQLEMLWLTHDKSIKNIVILHKKIAEIMIDLGITIDYQIDEEKLKLSPNLTALSEVRDIMTKIAHYNQEDKIRALNMFKQELNSQIKILEYSLDTSDDEDQPAFFKSTYISILQINSFIDYTIKEISPTPQESRSYIEFSVQRQSTAVGL